jgi:hypothetical protein
MRGWIEGALVLSALAVSPAALADDAPPPQVGAPTGPAAPAASPGDANLGGPGESCRARSDCRTGLKCVQSTCVDEREGTTCGATADCGGELKCVDKKCVSPVAKSRGGGGGGGDGGGDGGSEWLAFKLEGVHPFVGLTWLGGPVLGLTSGGFSTSRSSSGFLFGLRGGVFIDKIELAVELSPMTYFYYSPTPGPAFQFNGTVGYHIPLYEGPQVQVYWPLRGGVGMFTGNTGSNVLFQARADLVGVMIKVGHLTIDLNLPSFRYAVTDVRGQQVHYLTWGLGGGVGYVF